MSTQYGNTQFAEATLPELELNKETLQDLEVDGSQVKGGYLVAQTGVYITSLNTAIASGTSVINPSGG